MNNEYWRNFYKDFKETRASTFTNYAFQFIKDGVLVDLGCGNGRDLNFFLESGIKAYGVDESFNSDVIENQNVTDFIKFNKAPEYVYTRFFWHAIDRDVQLDILNWVKDYILIEARTTEDETLEKTFPEHKRNYVNVIQLVKDLKDRGFKIIELKEGSFSPYRNENPHLVRVVACKNT